MSLATCSAWSGETTGFTWPTGWGTSGKYKIISDRSFVFNGHVYPAGRISDPIDQNWCAIGDITVLSGVPTFESFTLPQTDVGITDLNSSGEPRLTLIIYSNNGRTRRNFLFQGWRIGQSLTTSFSFEDLAIYNTATQPANPRPYYLDADSVYRAINAAQYAPATPTQLGLIRIDTAAVNVADPEAVGSNSPRVTNQYYVGIYTSFSAAITAIGSTQATLVVASSMTVSASLSVPSNVTLRFTNSGALNIATGQTVTIAGPIVAPTVRIFTGSGAVSFSGNHHINTIYPEWWGAVADNSTNNATAIQAAEVALETLLCGCLQFSTGTYRVGSAITILLVKGITWKGMGRDYTKILATGGTPAVQCNGIWRSRFEGLFFETSASISSAAVFEMDGHYDGVNTQGVQGNTILDCYFNANQLAPYAFAMTRRGTNNGQGSENLFLNSNFDGGTSACYFQDGSNALQNTFIGGNFQSYPINGIYIHGGAVEVFSTGFQSTFAFSQYDNDGWDINVGDFGVGERIVVSGCRSESMQFFRDGGAQPGILIGCSNRLGFEGSWSANTALALDFAVLKTGVSLGVQLYRVTTAGTTGGSPPTWPNTGTVADGSVVWTAIQFDVVERNAGQSIGNNWEVGYDCPINFLDEIVIELTDDYTMTRNAYESVTFLVNATSKDITITLDSTLAKGQIINVKKYDTTAHTVTLTGGPNSPDLNGPIIIPGGTQGWLSVVRAGGAGLSGAVWTISSSEPLNTPGSDLTISTNTIAPTHNVHTVGAGLIKTITVPGGWTLGKTITLLTGATPWTTDATGNIMRAISPAATQAVTFTLAFNSIGQTRWFPSM